MLNIKKITISILLIFILTYLSSSPVPHYLSFVPSFDSASVLGNKKNLNLAVFSGSLPVYTLFREVSINPEIMNIPFSQNLFPTNPYYVKDPLRTNPYRTPAAYIGYLLRLGLKYDLELLIKPGMIPFVVDFIPYTEIVFDTGFKKQIFKKNTENSTINISLAFHSGYRNAIYYYGYPFLGSFILTNSFMVLFGKDFKTEKKQGVYQIASFNIIPTFEFNYNVVNNIIHLNNGFEQNFIFINSQRAAITVGYFINAGFMTYITEEYMEPETYKMIKDFADKKIFSLEVGLSFGFGGGN